MQKTAILLIALFAVSSLANTYGSTELNPLWNTWKNLHSKEYFETEEAARYAIFVDNYHKIIKYNAEHSNVKLRLNQFSDLTSHEFKQKMTGCAFPEQDQDHIKRNTIHFEALHAPDSVDWRSSNAVTPVKNQGQCGSCWTFSATGALEGFYAINNGQLLSFSEQQIVDCATDAGSGCDGGWPSKAIDYAAQAGMEQEDQYPYTASQGSCSYDQSQAIHVNSGSNFVTANDADALKSAIASVPVSVLIRADQEVFQSYSSGVIGPNDGCSSEVNHAVLAVGYGNIDGSDAFIIKNSWGDGWGQGGYVHMSTDGSANDGAGVCGVLSQPAVAVCEDC